MKTTMRIITPPGMFGVSSNDNLIVTAMRVIGVGFGDSHSWRAKYGVDYENDVFLMKRFCWCDVADGSCLWCMHGDHPKFDQLLGERFGFADYKRHSDRRYYDPPNFWFKPTDFRLTWYKYIGRDMASNKDELSGDFLHKIFATHPKGMKVDEAVAETERQQGETAKAFSAMLASLGVDTV